MMDGENIVPGNDARGWNDPPQFLYSAQKNSSATNLQALNKRVAHNLTSTETSTPSNKLSPCVTPPTRGSPIPGIPIASLPPVTILNTGASIAIQNTENGSVEIQAPDISDDEELCCYCVKCFTNCAAKLLTESKIEKRMCDDVKKRVKIFESMWKSDKISDKAKPKCGKLCRALELENWTAAYEFHLALMTDHISEVSQWMVAIKKLIQSAQS